jgi:hypothetical protein
MKKEEENNNFISSDKKSDTTQDLERDAQLQSFTMSVNQSAFSISYSLRDAKYHISSKKILDSSPWINLHDSGNSKVLCTNFPVGMCCKSLENYCNYGQLDYANNQILIIIVNGLKA